MSTDSRWEFPDPDEDAQYIDEVVAEAEELGRQGNYLSASACIEPARRSADLGPLLSANDSHALTFAWYQASRTYSVAGNVRRQLAGSAYVGPQRDTAAAANYLDEADTLLGHAHRLGEEAVFGAALANLDTRRRTELQFADAKLKLGHAILARVIILGQRGELISGRQYISDAQHRFDDWSDVLGYTDCRTLEMLMDYHTYSCRVSGFSARMTRMIAGLWKDIGRVAEHDRDHATAAHWLAVKRIALLFRRRGIVERAILLDY